MIPILLVAAGGALGACARVWISGAVARGVEEIFPWGTLVVNVSGALVIGALAAALAGPEGGASGSESAWLFLTAGLLGSYTTVSSFSLQVLALARVGERRRAALYVLASLALCLGAASAGYLAGARLAAG